MFVDLATVRKTKDGEQSLHLTVRPEEPIHHAGTEMAFITPVVVDVHLENTGTGVYADITAEGTGRLVCDRCLAPFDWPFDLHYREVYLTPQEAEQFPPETRSDDARYVVTTGDSVDIVEGLREAIIMALPMKHLCREDCLGLCDICGQNLNEGRCGCVREAGDPRLQVLRKLLNGLERGREDQTR